MPYHSHNHLDHERPPELLLAHPSAHTGAMAMPPAATGIPGKHTATRTHAHHRRTEVCNHTPPAAGKRKPAFAEDRGGEFESIKKHLESIK